MERMQVELREYRKRLSWVTSGNGTSAMNAMAMPSSYSRGMSGLNNNNFLFDFPKFGDLPGSQVFGNGQSKDNQSQKESPVGSKRNDTQVPGVIRRNTSSPSHSQSQSPASNTPNGSTNGRAAHKEVSSGPTVNSQTKPTTHDSSNSESPTSSSDSHQSQLASSSGTSPEPSPNFFGAKTKGGETGTAHGEKSFCEQLGQACGSINNPVPAVRHSEPNQPETDNSWLNQDLNFDFLAQQNGGDFDPVLFGDWREPQDAVLSQDFGSFFNDAFPLPDLGSPGHNLTEAATEPTPVPAPAPKKDRLPHAHKATEEEVVPGEDKSQMLSCTKIWYVLCPEYCPKQYSTNTSRDRLQSMDKFRNGEIDVDNLCSELRTKARCSEGGVVVNQTDVDDIMGRRE